MSKNMFEDLYTKMRNVRDLPDDQRVKAAGELFRQGFYRAIKAKDTAGWSHEAKALRNLLLHINHAPANHANTQAHVADMLERAHKGLGYPAFDIDTMVMLGQLQGMLDGQADIAVQLGAMSPEKAAISKALFMISLGAALTQPCRTHAQFEPLTEIITNPEVEKLLNTEPEPKVPVVNVPPNTTVN